MRYFVAAICFATVTMTACIPMSLPTAIIQKIELCRIREALGGGACISAQGPSFKTYAQINKFVCMNVKGMQALIKRAHMDEHQAIEALGLREE